MTFSKPATAPTGALSAGRRLLALTASALLALATVAPAVAPARSTRTHRTEACPSTSGHAAREGRTSTRCARPTVGHAKKKPSDRRRTGSKKTPHKPAPSDTRTAALCEDGSAPVRGQEGFECDDGSEPGCPNGSELVTTAAGRLLCEGPASSAAEAGETAAGEECDTEGTGECQSAAGGCEAAPQAGEPVLACEGSGGGEAAD